MPDIRIFTVLIALICFKNQLVLSDDEINYCYSNDEHPPISFGSKTPYELTHGLIKNTSVPNCDPVQIWMLVRHGTRNPAVDEIQNMTTKLPKLKRQIVKNHNNGAGSLCDEDVENIKNWKMDPYATKDKKKFLTPQGEEDLLSLGIRFNSYFPKLINNMSHTSEYKYDFATTNTQRTISSMLHFIDGAFDSELSDLIGRAPKINETLLKAYKNCTAWTNKTASANAEANLFKSSPEYEQVIHEVSERLGFSQDLSVEDIVIMYTACSFEKAWHVHKVSPWCAAFTSDDLQVLQYKEDLYYYYHTGYGDELNRKIGCLPLQDMFNHFTKLENGVSSEEPHGVFYFTHSTMLQMVFATMGIAKDSTPLKATNFKEEEDRKWNTSRLVPFAANLAAVLYKCDSSNKVRFYLNERPVDYEGCEGGVCDWEYLKNNLGASVANCNLDVCTQ